MNEREDRRAPAPPGEFIPAHVLAWSEALVDGRGITLPAIALWRPRGMTAALGLSQDAAREIEEEVCRDDGVGLIRRQSGGGAVLLCPGVLCWEAVATLESVKAAEGDSGIRQTYAFFSRPIISGLASLGLSCFQAGICDVSVAANGGGFRKIAGTAQLRRKERALTHGSLLVDADIDLLGKYLKFPSEQPDYRRDRSHRDFCVTVGELLGRKGDTERLSAEVAAAVAAAAKSMGWKVLSPPAGLSPEASRLKRDKYLSEGWNRERIRP